MENVSELKALISLIDEPDEVLFQQVQKHIYSYGMNAIPELEKAWEQTLDNQIQGRIEDIIQEIQQKQLFQELHNWALFEYNDLLNGFIILTRFQYPDLDMKAITHEIGAIIQQVWMEMNENLTPLEKVKVLNHVIYDINKFGGNTSNIKSPDNFYLKNLLDHRKGNPLSLGMLYILIAKSINIPIYGVNLPRHFVLAYLEESHIEPAVEATSDQVLFYLNPFNKGAVFTRNEIELYLRQMRLEKDESYFKPCSNQDIIRRMIDGLIETYNLASNEEKIIALKRLRKALDSIP